MDWSGLQTDAEARLLLYSASLAPLVASLGRLSLWRPLPLPMVRRRLEGLIDQRPDREIAETFYNSAIRRLTGAVGVDEEAEFLDLAAPQAPDDRTLPSIPIGAIEDLIPGLTRILESLGLTGWADLPGNAARLAGRLQELAPDLASGATITWLPTPFIRNRRAFLVGRLRTAGQDRPLIAAVTGGPAGLTVEALIVTPDEASIIFGFSRSPFHADLADPRRAVGFLHSMLPTKRLDELYTVIGYHRHGKREFYQALQRHLQDPEVRFRAD